MKIVNPTVKCVLLTSLLIYGGCGGGSKGTGGFDSGFAKNLPLDQLTTEDREAICSNFKYSANRVFTRKEVICPFAGDVAKLHPEQVGETDPIAACHKVVDLCDKNFDQSEFGDVDGLPCPVSLSNLTSSCSSTVGELNKCMNDLLEQYYLLLSGLQCTDQIVQEEENLPASVQPSSIASCQPVITKCPAFLD